MLKIILVFFLQLTFALIAAERGEKLHFFIFKGKKEHSSFSLYEKKSRDFMKEFLPEGDSKRYLEEFPKHLLHYVLYRLEFMQHSHMGNAIEKVISSAHFKEISPKTREFLQIPSSAFIKEFPLDFEFDLKYTWIKKTKQERPPLPLNYHAREREVEEGFEAGETLLSSFNLNAHWRIISRIGLFEKWVQERIDYETAHHMEIPQEEIQEFKSQLTGTLKYAIGCGWDFVTRDQLKMKVEFLMQQKTNNQWRVQQFLLSDSRASGAVFDHWVITMTFDF